MLPMGTCPPACVEILLEATNVLWFVRGATFSARFPLVDLVSAFGHHDIVTTPPVFTALADELTGLLDQRWWSVVEKARVQERPCG